jgi:membrane protein YdbS with pleckstrin-like domain
MKCSQCGQDLPAAAAFCPKCGAKLGSGANSGSSGAERLQEAGRGNQPAEEDLWIGSYSPKAMVGWAIGLAALTVAGLVVAILADGPGLMIWGIAAVVFWAILGLVILYRRMTVTYRLTTYRLFHETGLLKRTRDRIEVIDINDVTLQQGFIERMFNVGTIHLLSSDVTNKDLKMEGIDNVRRVTDLIDNTRRAERQRRGVFMENIGPGTGIGG